MDLLLLKVTALFGAALSGARLLRRASAAMRHALWTATFVSVLALPLLSWMVPTIRIPVATVHQVPTMGDVALAVPIEMERNASPSVFPPAGAEIPAVGLPVTSPVIPNPVAVVPTAGPETMRHWPRPTVRGVVFGVWLTGFVAALAAIVVSLVGVRHVTAAAEEMIDPDWRAALVAVSASLDLRPVRLLVSPSVTVPMAGGVWRPTIFLPVGARDWPIEQRAVVLAHETAHLASYDPLRHLIARLALAVYWFHPLAWFAGRQARADCEQACDQAIVAGGVLPSTYARVLLALAGSAARGRPALAALPIASRSGLERRLIAILNDETRRPRRGLALTMVVAVLVMVGAVGPLVPVSVAQPQFDAILIAEPISAAPSFSTPQIGAAQPSNVAVLPVNGTGAISGVVTDATTSRPVAGALVSLVPLAGDVAGPALRQLTDSTGRFAFTRLSAGDGYQINGGTFGYLGGGFGRLTPDSATRLIVLQEGQWFREANITLWRPAAINGTVRDEAGEPVVGALVNVVAQMFIAGELRLAAGPAAKTDDRGGYRIPNLRPGTYFVVVPSVQVAVPASTANLTMSGIPIDATNRLLLGPYVPPPPSSTNGAPRAYPVTFYPSARTVGGATPFDLHYGDDRQGVDVQLFPVPVVRVSGRVDGPPQELTNITARLMPLGSETLGTGSEAATALVEPSGAFTFLNVPAGSYTILVSRSLSEYTFGQRAGGSPFPIPPGEGRGGRGVSVVFSAPTGTNLNSRVGQGGGGYSGRTRIDVSDRSLTDVAVALQHATTLSGRLVREGRASSATPPRADTSPIVILTEPANGDPTLGQTRGVIQQDDPTMSFTIAGLRSGEYLLRLLGGQIKSIMWEGKDYANRPFDTSSGQDISGVVLTTTDQVATMTGVVRDAKGAPSTNAVVIYFPQESEQWTKFGLQPPRHGSTLATSTGTYSVARAPAGAYFVVAVDEASADGWKNPKFLEAAAAVATRVLVGWGETKTQNLVIRQIVTK